MLLLARTVIGVASDVLRVILSFLYSSGAIRAQNLVLRKQLSSSIERGIKPPRADHATRVSLALFSRLSIGAMPSSSCDRRPSFAGTDGAAGFSGA